MTVTSRLSAALTTRYTIDREIGSGGMAAVYLAHDVRHDRAVAIKVLHPELGAALGGERFLAEIRTTAKLQHPHILPVLDSGEADGLLFYVMPMIAGESLRDRLVREKQLSIADALRIAKEVASALDYAHRQGVIHRDIKPENILLHDGQAMVADFGIALAVQSAGGARMTQTGLSLGTPQYMSPEQAMGEKTIDVRSDIYSLGAVTYEMLAGDAPFTGSSVQAIVAKVLVEKPTPLHTLRDTVPPEVERAVLTALAKLPADRFPSAHAFAEALTGPAPSHAPAGETAHGGGSGPLRTAALLRRRAPLTFFVLATAVGVTGWWRAGRAGAGPPVVRFALSVPKGLRFGTLVAGSGSKFAVSPDGHMIAMIASGGGVPQTIFTRTLDDPVPRPLHGTEGGSAPFFSPDGQWIGFIADSRLKKVRADGGPVVSVTDQLGGFISGASWGANDQIAIATGGQLLLVSASGGTPRGITKQDTVNQRLVRWPRFLADGKTVAYTSWTNSVPDARIGIASTVTGRTTVLDLPGTFPLGVIDGWLYYAGVTTPGLMAVPFDVRAFRATGPPVQVLESLVESASGAAHVALSSNGTLVYENGTTALHVALADLHGGMRVLIPEARAYTGVRYSPDARRIALSIGSGAATDIWIYDIASATMTRLTTEGSSNDRPEWTPDGKRIVFRTDRGGGYSLWWQPIDGSAPAEGLLKVPGRDIWEGQFAPDGRSLVYRTGSVGSADVFVRAVSGDTATHAIAATKFTEWAARVSPDGHWIAYSSDESGVFQVYVRPFPGAGPRVQLSSNGGDTPVWSHDGKRIFYSTGQQFVRVTLALPQAPASAAAVIARDTLFSGDFMILTGHALFDVAADGNGLLIIKPDAGDVTDNVVVNWLAEVEARLGGKRRP